MALCTSTALRSEMPARKKNVSETARSNMQRGSLRSHLPTRILLASPNTRLLASLTRQLCAKGHRVCAITSLADGPQGWSPSLYDVVVFSADDHSAALLGFCDGAKKADSRLLLVMLSTEALGTASHAVPDVVIADADEVVIGEKLIAVLHGSALSVA